MIRKPKTTLEYLLLALVPYSGPNIDLVINLPRFFNELEKVSGVDKKSLRNSFYRAKKRGYVEQKDGKFTLTSSGKLKVLPYTAKELKGNVVLMVMFDIPEEHRDRRDKLRRFLQSLDFEQVQLSVWSTTMNYKSEVKTFTDQLDLEECIEVFESVKL